MTTGPAHWELLQRGRSGSHSLFHSYSFLITETFEHNKTVYVLTFYLKGFIMTNFSSVYLLLVEMKQRFFRQTTVPPQVAAVLMLL